MSSVTNISHMFYNSSAFNNGDPGNNSAKPLNWTDTSGVTIMSNVFFFATAFNQDISSWDTSSVTTMTRMLSNATIFNNGGVALSWTDTSNVTDMSYMFSYAKTFNQDIGDWDTSSVTNMEAMFLQDLGNPGLFNQYLSKWDLTGIVTADALIYCFPYQNALNQTWIAGDSTGGEANSWYTKATTLESFELLYQWRLW